MYRKIKLYIKLSYLADFRTFFLAGGKQSFSERYSSGLTETSKAITSVPTVLLEAGTTIFAYAKLIKM